VRNGGRIKKTNLFSEIFFPGSWVLVRRRSFESEREFVPVYECSCI